jgi:hypothetical protein
MDDHWIVIGDEDLSATQAPKRFPRERKDQVSELQSPLEMMARFAENAHRRIAFSAATRAAHADGSVPQGTLSAASTPARPTF